MKRVTKFNDDEITHLKHCLEDLLLIEKAVTASRMSWQDVRSILLPLRRLVISEGGELKRCWRLVYGKGKPFYIQAKELPKHVRLSNILVSCGSNIGSEIMDQNGALIASPPSLSDEEVHKLQWAINFETKLRDFSIDEYLASICLSIYGVSISRLDLINYVANKSGGVHVDTKARKPSEKSFKALDEIAKKAWVNGKNLPYLEAQATALYLNYSDCTIELKNALNDEFKDSLEWQFI